MKIMLVVVIFSLPLAGCAQKSIDKHCGMRPFHLKKDMARSQVEKYYSSKGVSNWHSWEKTSYLNSDTGESVIVEYDLLREGQHSPQDQVLSWHVYPQRIAETILK